MAKATSYIGDDGVTINPKTPAELYEALDIVHGFAVDALAVHEGGGSELNKALEDVREIVGALSVALEGLEPLASERDWI